MSLNKLATLALLLGLVSNHTKKHCPCQHCRCRCHLYKLSHHTYVKARMETVSLLVQSVSDVPIDSIEPILSPETLLEPSIPPLKSTKKSSISKKYKRSLSNVMTKILYVNDVKFNPLQVPYCPPQLRLSIDINTDDVYVIFSLF